MRPPLAVGFAVMLMTAACGGIIDPSDNRVVEMSGTLQVAGQSGHQFSVDKNGEFSIKFTAFAPDANSAVGVTFGQVLEGFCRPDPFYTNNFAQLNRTALTGRISRGTFCILVFDSGALTAPQTYTLQVSHP
jgi:hypothetical protein